MEPLPSSLIAPGRTIVPSPDPQRTVEVALMRTATMTTAGLARKTADCSSASVAASDSSGWPAVSSHAARPSSTPNAVFGMYSPWSSWSTVRPSPRFAGIEGNSSTMCQFDSGPRSIVQPAMIPSGGPTMQIRRTPGLEQRGRTVATPMSVDERMDGLPAETAELVARAVEMKADAPAIFDRVRAMAAAGTPARVAPGMAKGRKRPPRLTEAWFCRAEPTRGQLVLTTLSLL